MKRKSYAVLAVFLFTTGCASMRSYNNETMSVVSNIGNGNVDGAIATLEKNTGSEKDLLYFMEKGELQRLKKLPLDTVSTWTEADKMISQWEDEEKINAKKIGENISSFIINDKLKRYDGEDYEKVMLSTRLALAYLASGKTEDAMVEIKKTWERENLIKTLHEKDIEDAEEQAKSKGYTTKSEDLKGYPIATLNSPEVTNLKNGYQNAFSHYLSGFLYEAAGDISLATASYRTAIELQPSLKLLKDGLIGIENRAQAINLANKENNSDTVEKVSKKNKNNRNKHKKNAYTKRKKDISMPIKEQTAIGTSPVIEKNDSDVLLVIENGVAPYKKSITIPIPVPQAGIVPISFPIIETDPISASKVTSVILSNDLSVPLTVITSIENLSRRSLKDQLPWIMVRSAIRAAIKGGAQAAAYKQNALAGLAVNALNVATEQADERTWKLLPSDISIARVRLPEGVSTIKIQTSQGVKDIVVKVTGKHVVIPIRLIGNTIYNLQEE